MISDETVFILGAGASAPYGYPTGNELRDDICLNFKTDMNKISEKSKGDYFELRDLMKVADDFINCFRKSRNRSIDRWLSLNGEYKDIGKLAIVNAIVKRENRGQITFEGEDRSLDWFSILFNEMMVGVALPQHFGYHKVSFITFNYDRLFEHLLYESFRNTFSKVRPEDINTILSGVTILHVFGCIDEPPWKKGEYKYGGNYTLSYLDEARKRIKIVSESVADYTRPFRSQMDLLLRSARKILFLGFGYDLQNLKILGIPKRFADASQFPTIIGTGRGLFREEINSIEIRMKLAKSFEPHVEPCDCAELLRKYFVGQDNDA